MISVWCLNKVSFIQLQLKWWVLLDDSCMMSGQSKFYPTTIKIVGSFR